MNEPEHTAVGENTISSEQLQTYLLSKKWFEDGKIRNVATVWHRHEDDDAEIILPLPEARDYQQRLIEAVSTIALRDERGVLEIINEIKRPFFNLISVRVIHSDTKDGTIPIRDGVLLIAKAKDLLLAAAQSIYSKKKLFKGRAPKAATSYLDTLLLGQTAIGSYIVNVIAPVSNSSSFDQTTTADIPLAQSITHNLIASLDALKKASSEYETEGEIKAFDKAISSGASANLCDALLGFSGEQRNRTFEIRVSVAPTPLFDGSSQKFEFGTDHVGLIEKAKNYYKDDYVLYRRTLIGHIRKLSRLKDETAGTVTLQAHVDDAERNIQVELSGDDYHLAVIAHDNSELVKVSGDLHIKSKRSYLLNPSGFGIIRNEDLNLET